MNILDKIIQNKRVEVEQNLAGIKNSELRRTQKDLRIPKDFKKQLSNKNLSIISEVKKASPSKGLIRPDFDPCQIAVSYQQAGTDCISVLTDKKFFQGELGYLTDIRKTVSCPLLRKDFIIDERQIRESYDMGADAILLIVSVLNESQLLLFKKIATEFELSCLVEVHAEHELELALKLNFDLIGINNRNLSTFKTNITHSMALKEQIPDSVITVSESGIKTADDCLQLQQAGFNAILVGECLMRQLDPGQALKNLMCKVR